MDAGFEERVGRRRMHVIGRDDRHGLNSIRPLGLRLGHAFEIVVNAIGGKAERLARAARLLRRRRQSAGDELVVIVDSRRDTMYSADKGALAAADHAESDAAFLGLATSLDRHVYTPSA